MSGRDLEVVGIFALLALVIALCCMILIDLRETRRTFEIATLAGGLMNGMYPEGIEVIPKKGETRADALAELHNATPTQNP